MRSWEDTVACGVRTYKLHLNAAQATSSFSLPIYRLSSLAFWSLLRCLYTRYRRHACYRARFPPPAAVPLTGLTIIWGAPLRSPKPLQSPYVLCSLFPLHVESGQGKDHIQDRPDPDLRSSHAIAECSSQSSTPLSLMWVSLSLPPSCLLPRSMVFLSCLSRLCCILVCYLPALRYFASLSLSCVPHVPIRHHHLVFSHLSVSVSVILPCLISPNSLISRYTVSLVSHASLTYFAYLSHLPPHLLSLASHTLPQLSLLAPHCLSCWQSLASPTLPSQLSRPSLSFASPLLLSSLLPLTTRCLFSLPKLFMPTVSPTHFCLICVACVTMCPALLRISASMRDFFLLSPVESIACSSLLIHINKCHLIVIQLLSVILILVWL